ncbi:MAG TPA: cytochrome bc complex cytochrome b subunit [Steroidobacteraceae bacterium]|nr:cytochrome bc complex cytochrome b subunit [Steroidobacteraceae bacterium]
MAPTERNTELRSPSEPLPPGATPVSKKRGFWAWINRRLPVDEFIANELTGYYAPKNFNFWYFFGSLAMLVLVMQLVTGIFLTMFYKPSAVAAFGSVQYIMREVDWGWLIRYMHSTGASLFFVVVYLHMFRALLYGSYRQPRELLWLIGMMVYFALMAEAFMGYVLPWGNMSFWGAQVIVNIFGTVPIIGTGLTQWIRGDYGISDATLNRFFALHVAAVPIILLLLVMLHLVALHRTGSNNPDGIEIKDHLGPDGKPLDGIPFHPYYTVKDFFGVGVFLSVFALIVFYVPTFHGIFLEKANFEPANPLSTPAEIHPVWYFTPFYAILRGVPSKGLGALLLLLALVSLLVLPWLDGSPVKSIRYKGWISRVMLGVFVVSFAGLGYLGMQPAEGIYIILSRFCMIGYYAFFWLMPFYSRFDRVRPVPERVVYHAH